MAITGEGKGAAVAAKNVVAHIGDIFERRGGEAYLGEAVTMAEHMLQAAHLAEQEGADEALVAAALLHDIGNFTGDLGCFTMADRFDRRHEEAGADFLAQFFPQMVHDSVRWHVAAKRYLCATEPDYYACLSGASRHSLQLQGGPMSAQEAAAFAAEPHLSGILRMRRWDDAAKVPGRQTPAFRHYVPLLERLVKAGPTAS